MSDARRNRIRRKVARIQAENDQLMSDGDEVRRSLGSRYGPNIGGSEPRTLAEAAEAIGILRELGLIAQADILIAQNMISQLILVVGEIQATVADLEGDNDADSWKRGQGRGDD